MLAAAPAPRTHSHGQSGQAAVEVALALPLVALVLLVVVHVGLVVRDAVLVTHAAREAARAAAVEAGPGVAERAAQAAAPLDAGRLRVAEQRAAGRVQISVSYESDPAVPLAGRLLPAFQLSSRVSMQVEG